MKFPSEYYPWLDALLSEDSDSVRRALTQLPAAKLEHAGLHAIHLVWQLNPDEELRAEAATLLKGLEKAKDLKATEKAFEIFRSISDILPWMDENAAATQQNNFAEFRNILSKYEYFFAKYPFYTEIWLDMGRKLYMLFKLEAEATICFESIVEHNPNCDEAQYALGRIAERKGKTEMALDYYEKAIELNPNNAYAHLQAGILKSTVLGRYQEAIEHFNKVVEDDPYSAEPYIRTAEAYYFMKENERCKQFLEIALGINEYHEDALNLLGTLQWKVENNTEKAIATFQKGIDHKIHSDSALLLKSLGDIHALQLQDYNKARLFYEKSLKVNPGQKQIIQVFIPILLRTFHDLDAVTQCYNLYLEKEPEDAESKTAYAAFLIEYLHDYETAHLQLKSALEINPELAEAQKLMSRIASYVEPEEEEEKDEEEEEDVLFDDDIEVDFDEEEDDDDDDFSGGGAAGDS